MALGDLKSRLRAKFGRRNSTTSSLSSQQTTGASARETSRSLTSRQSHKAPSTTGSTTINDDGNHLHNSKSKPSERNHTQHQGTASTALPLLHPFSADEDDSVGRAPPDTRDSARLDQHGLDRQQETTASKLPLSSATLLFPDDSNRHHSSSTAGASTPNTDITPIYKDGVDIDTPGAAIGGETIEFQLSSFDSTPESPAALNTTLPQHQARPAELERKQSLLPHQQTRLIKTLLETDLPSGAKLEGVDYFRSNGPSTISPNMVSRKIWVKRPGASATLVSIHEDDLVDDVRDMILKKYANSLGRNFDAPDVNLRIIPREQRQERILGPEEPMGRTLDAYYPGGQLVDEALVIDVPVKRTPKPSPIPHPQQRYYEEIRPAEAGTDYFPQMPIPAIPSPHLPNALPAINHHPALTAHSMSVLTTGQVPPLPSPGSVRRHHNGRPRMGRQHTSSPTVISTHSQSAVLNNGTHAFVRGPRSRTHSSASEKSAVPPVAPPLLTPPAQNSDLVPIPRIATPPPRVSSPRPAPRASKKAKKATEHPSLPTGMLNGAVPPINVLIVEDNIINLKLLEAFMKRLKVRWQTAMNGREAVNKWRTGGFHLVLMDIQLPIMNGLEATKEIRRLERVNNIGVFSSSASSIAPDQMKDEAEGDDKLSASTLLFKSPVIIVALTASSLQSDRHEALAAGCNDFLTKVSFCGLLIELKSY